MTKITSTKLGRKFESSVSHPNTIVKKEKMDAPEGRQPVMFIWKGKEITGMVSPGQIINKDKAYMRQIQREAEDRIARRQLLK